MPPAADGLAADRAADHAADSPPTYRSRAPPGTAARPGPFLLLFILAAAAFAPSPARGIVDSELFTANAKYLRQFMSFEFGAGGTADVTVDWNPNVVLPLRIYVCDTSQMAALLERYNSIEEICVDFNSTGGCEAVLNVNDGLGMGATPPGSSGDASGADARLGQRWTATVNRNVVMNFHYLNCNSITTKFRMKYELMNPGGEQLGLGQIPLKSMYEALFVVWLVLVVCIFLDVLFAMTFGGLRALFNLLNSFILIVVLLTTASVGVERYYWTTYSHTGRMDTGLREMGNSVSGARSKFYSEMPG